MNGLQAGKVILVDYLKMKVEEQDWHAVADAAMDLRELEIKIAMELKLPGHSEQSARSEFEAAYAAWLKVKNEK